MATKDKGKPARERAERGTKQIKRVGFDPTTRKAKFAARFTVKGKRTYVTLDATTIEQARVEYVDRVQKAKDGKPWREPPPPPPTPEAPKPTVRDLAVRFCGYTGKRLESFRTGAGREARDPVNYRRNMWTNLNKHVLPHIGDMVAAEVARRDIKAMQAALLDARVHNRTVQKAIASTSRLFNWAIDDEEIFEGSNPCARVRKPATPSSTEFYTTEEVARLLATAAKQAPELHPLVAFAFYTGARKGEIAAVQWRDVHLDGDRPVILLSRSWGAPARKSGKPVTVVVHPHLGAILRGLRAASAPETGEELVFPVDRGRPGKKAPAMRDRFDNWGLRELAKAAEVRWFKHPWHAFRHAYATELANQGSTLLEIRDALGQSTLQMASTYTNLAADHMRKRIESLPVLGPVSASPVVSLDAQRAKAAAGKGKGRGR